MPDDAPASESGRRPRVFVPVPSEALLSLDELMGAGVEPVVMGLPADLPAGGVALRREWVADWTEIFCANNEIDAMILGAEEPEILAGLLIAALRLDLPAVALPAMDPFPLAFAAMGFSPLHAGKAIEVAVGVAKAGQPRPRELVSTFSLANALRIGLSVGAGPELLVHLAALAREAGVSGFSRMLRVLAPEGSAVADHAWLREHGLAGLIAGLGRAVHDTPTVTGRLKESLPQEAPPLPEGDAQRLSFLHGRASGTEVVCRAYGATEEIAGECRVFVSEEEAVRAVKNGEVGEGHLLVVTGCGARGGPGLLALNGLGEALVEAGLHVPVLTDGLPPSNASGKSPWISLFSPEAALDGVIGLLRDGDTLRFDLAGGRIRTAVSADDLESREPLVVPTLSSFGYAARYARTALPALEGAGFE